MKEFSHQLLHLAAQQQQWLANALAWFEAGSKRRNHDGTLLLQTQTKMNTSVYKHLSRYQLALVTDHRLNKLH